jgi:hypothetical protein
VREKKKKFYPQIQGVTVTRDGMKPPKNPEKLTTSEEKKIHLNARAKNCLYESLSMEIVNKVFTLKMLMIFG